MKNLFLLLTIFSLAACSSSDNDPVTTTPTATPTIAETIIGNWSTQITNSQGSMLIRITFTEAGEMSLYENVSTTTGLLVEEKVEGKTWTIEGNQITTSDTFEDEVDTLTVTVIDQDSVTVAISEETINLSRDTDYESSLTGDWEGTDTDEDCTSTQQISFTSSNNYSAIITNMDCNNVVMNLEGTFTRTRTLSGTLSLSNNIDTSISDQYYAIQGDKIFLRGDEGDTGFLLEKQ